MKLENILSILKDSPIVIAKLGAGGDSYDSIPLVLRPVTVLICLDAATDPGEMRQEEFAKVVLVREVIAADATEVTFIERAWWGCSSILPVNEATVRRFGQEELVREKSRRTIVPTTLPSILKANGITALDQLTTDLEGIDFAVIQSCRDYLEGVIILQSELRFAPCYEGEGYFHDAAKFLYDRGFRLIGLKPDYWKPMSSRMEKYTDGCVVWADCLFFREGAVAERKLGQAGLIKAILLLVMAQKTGYAAHLLEANREHLTPGVYAELLEMTKPLSAWVRWRDFAAACRREAQLKLANSRWYGFLQSLLRKESRLSFRHLTARIDNI